MNDPLARTTELAFVDMTAFVVVDAVHMPPDIVSVAVLELVTPVAAAAVTLPVIVTGPVELFVTPAEVDAVTFPIILIVAVELLNTALELVAAPAVKFPVMLVMPVELLTIQFEFATDPPIIFPVIVNVPVPECNAAEPDPALAAVQFPTMLAVAGDAAENDKQFMEAVELLCVTFAVNVTPLLRTYVPVPALLNSVQVTLAVIVIT